MSDELLLPPIDEENEPFWDGCRRGELRVQRCAATGRPTARSSLSAVPWDGTRSATVLRPALTNMEMLDSTRRRRTRVRGPGQKRAARRSARASKTASRRASDTSARWAIRGLSLGRPLALKTARTAVSLVASAPRP